MADARARRRSRTLQIAGLTLWVALMGLAYAKLVAYKLTPGARPTWVGRWPEGSSLVRAASGPTLLVFVHPRCACTRATLATLRQVLSGRRVATTLVIRGGAGDLAAWRTSDIWRAAEDLPVTIVADPEGAEARRFGAVTSGQVSLYDAAGALVFEGGITPGRGHMGDNAQLTELLARLDHAGPVPGTPAPGAVFGCGLLDAVVEARR